MRSKISITIYSDKESVMMTIKTFIKEHPLLTYYALTFTISWGWILILVGPGGFPAKVEQFERLMPFVYPAMFVGPSLAGILMTGLIYGRAGFRELGSRLFRWRLGARWYAIALLTAPLVILVVLLSLSLTSSKFLPLLYTSNDKAFLLWYPIAAGLITAIFEELGWTGFATEIMLRQRQGVLRTGLSVGFFFATWNFLVVFWSGAYIGTLSPAIFLTVALFTWLPTYRVLVVWVYDRTGSLLVAILMVASLVAFWTSFTPQAALAGIPLAIFYIVLTAALWVVIIAVLRMQTPPRPERGVPPIG
jgi:membrane protease YdiL (CAAX protease family)